MTLKEDVICLNIRTEMNNVLLRSEAFATSLLKCVRALVLVCNCMCVILHNFSCEIQCKRFTHQISIEQPKRRVFFLLKPYMDTVIDLQRTKNICPIVLSSNSCSIMSYEFLCVAPTNLLLVNQMPCIMLVFHVSQLLLACWPTNTTTCPIETRN